MPAPGAAEIPKTGNDCFKDLPVRRGWTLADRMEIPEALTLNLTQSMNSLKKKQCRDGRAAEAEMWLGRGLRLELQ